MLIVLRHQHPNTQTASALVRGLGFEGLGFKGLRVEGSQVLILCGFTPGQCGECQPATPLAQEVCMALSMAPAYPGQNAALLADVLPPPFPPLCH